MEKEKMKKERGRWGGKEGKRERERERLSDISLLREVR
jgi:hypothetical protein